MINEKMKMKTLLRIHNDVEKYILRKLAKLNLNFGEECKCKEIGETFNIVSCVSSYRGKKDVLTLCLTCGGVIEYA